MAPASPSRIPFRWISRDGWLLITARFFLSFGQGFTSVLLAIYLVLQGLSEVFIGLFLTLGLAGAAFFTFLVGLMGDSLGRRRLMALFALAAGLVGLALIVTDQVVPLLVLAFLGSFSLGGPAGDTIQPLEQASLPQTCAPERRTELFAITAIARQAGTALGALAAGLPAIYQSSFGMSQLGAYQLMIVGYILFMALSALLYSVLSPSVEVASPQRWTNPLNLASRGIIFKLSALFAVDNFASGLTIQTLVVYWFFIRFDLQLGSIAFIFFLSNTITAISFWVAAWLANRIGLINTMVFTHIPSSLLLLALPFVPSAWLAVALWQVRSFFSQMDAPTRQSYTMAVVPENERTAMSVYNSVSRTGSMSASPTIAGVLWSIGSASVPFITCGVLKIAYDLALFLMFRNLKPGEEIAKSEQNRRPVSPG